MTVLQTHAGNIDAALQQNGFTPGPIINDIEQLLTALFSAMMSCFPTPTPAPTPAQAYQALYKVKNPRPLERRHMLRICAAHISTLDPEDTLAAVQQEAMQTTVGDAQAMMTQVHQAMQNAAPPFVPSPPPVIPVAKAGLALLLALCCLPAVRADDISVSQCRAAQAATAPVMRDLPPITVGPPVAASCGCNPGDPSCICTWIGGKCVCVPAAAVPAATYPLSSVAPAAPMTPLQAPPVYYVPAAAPAAAVQSESWTVPAPATPPLRAPVYYAPPVYVAPPLPPMSYAASVVYDAPVTYSAPTVSAVSTYRRGSLGRSWGAGAASGLGAACVGGA